VERVFRRLQGTGGKGLRGASNAVGQVMEHLLCVITEHASARQVVVAQAADTMKRDLKARALLREENLRRSGYDYASIFTIGGEED
jgi:hypothetical protein